MTQIRIDAAKPGPTINPNIYGHFSEHLGRCIYEGIWVGEDSPIPNVRGIRTDVVEALRALKLPVLRWPGGCFADEYHWKDGIGPRDQRPSMMNTHWGRVVENNHFGTHEFLDFCEMIDTDAYVCGNVGSGSPQEMMEWVDYMTSDGASPMPELRRKNGREKPWKLPYFGVGNESWGCGGNMRPEFYADLYRQFNTFVKEYSGNRIYRIACGANTNDVKWTDVMMERVGRRMHGLSLHYYTLLNQKWPPSGSATEFGNEEYVSLLASALHMDEILKMHIEVMDKHDPEKHVGLIVDEWGTWQAKEPGSHEGFLYQQNAVRDALVAAVHFHIFHNHADRVKMANIAQLINVLQAVILTDGARMLRTPTYWVFEMYKGHHGATALSASLNAPTVEAGPWKVPALSVSASKAADGTYTVTVANLDPAAAQAVEIYLDGAELKTATARVLSGASPQDHNTFDAPDRVSPKPLAVTLAGAKHLSLSVPAHSVVAIHCG